MDYSITERYNYWLDTVYDSWEIRYVPNKYKDYNMYFASISNNGRLLCCIPEDIIDYNMCVVAIINNSNALYDVPDRLIDYKLCELTIIYNDRVLSSIPDKYRTFELLLLIPKLNDHAKHINWDILDQSQQEFIKLKYGL